ncbi:MAG: hypothetical protein DHS20C16_19930 [Phycisphaerae bacterium]|nr:MAG: hypothetical protein DHS20C16_19930 [Phycisphaerae bacterium]
MGGCATQKVDRYLGAAPEKMVGEYSDLFENQYTVIADFETAHQLKLFSIEGPGTPEKLKRDRKSGVPVTGVNGLRFVLRSSADTLVADNRYEPTIPLAGDWRDFRLLQTSLYCPLQGLELEIAIRSGSGGENAEALSVIPLKQGWNLIRLDLSDAAPVADLSNVTSLSWRIVELAAPVELFIDDIILADNRTTFSGTPGEGDGGLYVQQEGRLINVGSPGRFELGFGNGQIVRWYALDRDKDKNVNLVGSAGALGPIPVVLTDPDKVFDNDIPLVPDGFSSLGGLVSARQRIIEANDVVVIVECTWAFPDSVQEPVDHRTPFQKWTYSIYQTGQVFVAVECTSERGDFKPEFIGMVVSRRLVDDMVAGKHEPAGLHKDALLQHLSFAWMEEPKTKTGLFWVIYNSRQYPQLRGMVDEDSNITSVAAYGGRVDYPIHRAASMFTVWPPGNCTKSVREPQAIYYCQKMDLEIVVGELLTATKGDVDGSGFNESLGAYMIMPDANQVHVKLDGRRQPLVDPVFCIEGVDGREASVYFDYAIHQNVARLSDGRLLIQIPRTITGESVLEVYLKNASVSPQ